MGNESMEVEEDFETLFKEWLKEEEAVAPVLSEERKKIFEQIPKVAMPDEQLKNLCLPWKDAIIITLMGKRLRLDEMRKRLEIRLGSSDFESVDMANNYFILRSESKQMRTRLLNEGPWVIQGTEIGHLG